MNNVFSVKARLETSGQGGDLLLDSHVVHVWEMIVKFPEIMFWAIAKNMKGDLCWSMLVQTGKDFKKEVLIGTPWGGGNKNLLAPPGGVNKNLLPPPQIIFLMMPYYSIAAQLLVHAILYR